MASSPFTAGLNRKDFLAIKSVAPPPPAGRTSGKPSSSSSNIPVERLKHFVDTLCSDARRHRSAAANSAAAKKTTAATSAASARPGNCASALGKNNRQDANSGVANGTNTDKSDPWSCAACAGVLAEPACLPCGHTYCCRCLDKVLAGVKAKEPQACKKCGLRLLFVVPVRPAVSVLVNKLSQKYWHAELRSVGLRTEGNQYFQEGKLEEALALYSQAVELGEL